LRALDERDDEVKVGGGGVEVAVCGLAVARVVPANSSPSSRAALMTSTTVLAVRATDQDRLLERAVARPGAHAGRRGSSAPGAGTG